MKRGLAYPSSFGGSIVGDVVYMKLVVLGCFKKGGASIGYQFYLANCRRANVGSKEGKKGEEKKKKHTRDAITLNRLLVDEYVAIIFPMRGARSNCHCQ